MKKVLLTALATLSIVSCSTYELEKDSDYWDIYEDIYEIPGDFFIDFTQTKTQKKIKKDLVD